MITQHINDVYYTHVISWAERVAEPLIQNNRWPLCPYAIMSIVNSTVKVWSADDYQDLATIAQSFEHQAWALEVVIFRSADRIEEYAAQINREKHLLIALVDDPSMPGDIAGHNPSNQRYPLIILQDRKDLMAKRQSLAQTDYYSTWADWYKNYVVC